MTPFETRVTRRALLAGAAALGVVRCAPAASRSGRLSETQLAPGGVGFTAKERDLLLPGRSGASKAWLYGPQPFPVIRMKKGAHFSAHLTNALAEHTSIHWHGVRVPNDMDGVPYLTQKPVQTGEHFSYAFTPPDSGTFFFHPHCDTVQQLGRGLAGVLVVEDGYAVDDDIVCVLKDWRVDEKGGFLPFLTEQGAGKAGTFGTLRTLNGQARPDIEVPAGADIRVRLINVDSTRIIDFGLPGVEAFIAAIDGNAVEPFLLESWRLGPAMRIDLVLRTPEKGALVLTDYFAPEPVTLGRLVVAGVPKRSGKFVVRPLPAPVYAEPDLSNARRHQLHLSASAVATPYAIEPIKLANGDTIEVQDALCTASRIFWALDGKTWPSRDHSAVPPPLLDLKRGETLELEFLNTTPHPHPMHLHGHAFKVLSASRMKRPIHWADTVLVMPDERVRVAFVADNPGNWMIHCHIIEHQETGMMAWFRVS